MIYVAQNVMQSSAEHYVMHHMYRQTQIYANSIGPCWRDGLDSVGPVFRGHLKSANKAIQVL